MARSYLQNNCDATPFNCTLVPVKHVPTAARFTALDDQIGFGRGATKQGHPRIPFLLRESIYRLFGVICRSLHHIALAQTTCAIVAALRQVVAMSLRSLEDGFASFGGKGLVLRQERDLESHIVFLSFEINPARPL